MESVTRSQRSAQPVTAMSRISAAVPVAAMSRDPAVATGTRRRLVALLVAVGLTVVGCDLLSFHDSAAPPFVDRLAITRDVGSLFGDLRDKGVGIEMNVVDNGERSFLLVRGPGRDNLPRVIAFDESLGTRATIDDLWDIRNAFVDAAGNFVVARSIFSGTDFSPIGDAAHGFMSDDRYTGILREAGGAAAVVMLSIVGDIGLEAGPSYDAEWGTVSNLEEAYEIHPDPASGLEPPPPLSAFRRMHAGHDVSRGRSGLALWNEQLSRYLVLELSSALVGDMQDDSVPPAVSFLTEVAPHIFVGRRDWDSVFYTRRGVVVVSDDDEQHTVYRMSDGSRIGQYSADYGRDYLFAYSPDGRWVYSLDLRRGRLYKARTWW